MTIKPYIARDNGKPLVVLGGYRVAISGAIIPVTMFPSGDVVTVQEAKKRLGRPEW